MSRLGNTAFAAIMLAAQIAVGAWILCPRPAAAGYEQKQITVVQPQEFPWGALAAVAVAAIGLVGEGIRRKRRP